MGTERPVGSTNQEQRPGWEPDVATVRRTSHDLNNTLFAALAYATQLDAAGTTDDTQLLISSIRDSVELHRQLQSALFGPRASEGAAHPASDSAPPGCRILLVEDEPSLREAIRRMLARHGFEVTVAHDGPCAFDAAAHARSAGAPFHSVVTDVLMPRMPGVELVRRIREHQPEMPVLFVSGHAQPAMGDVERFGNGTAFLQKPFDEATLIAALTNILTGTGRTHDEVVGP